MLPRSQRLNTASFSIAFAQGRGLRHPLMQVRVLLRPILPSNEVNLQCSAIKTDPQRSDKARIAFVVPKKMGKAAVRNRLRRRVRELYRLHPARANSALGACDLIFVMAPPALAATSELLADALTQLLRRASRASAEM